MVCWQRRSDSRGLGMLETRAPGLSALIPFRPVSPATARHARHRVETPLSSPYPVSFLNTSGAQRVHKSSENRSNMAATALQNEL